MLTRDYIMRLINTLVKVLAKVLFRKDAKDYEGALQQIDKAVVELLGFDGKFMRSVSNKQLVELFGLEQATFTAKCYTAGVLFKEEAEVLELQGKEDESLNMYVKSFNIFIEGLKKSPKMIEPEHYEKINAATVKIENEELSIAEEENLFFYYEFSGRFDKAENLLFELINSKSEWIDKGISFYTRLLEKSKEELMQGGLPKEEIPEGLDRLKEMKESRDL